MFCFCFLIRLISLSSSTITFLLYLVQNKEQNFDLSLSSSLPQQNRKIYKSSTAQHFRKFGSLRPVEPATPGTAGTIARSLTHSLTSATDLSSRITCWSSSSLTARPDWAGLPPAPSPDCSGSSGGCCCCCCRLRRHKRGPSAAGSGFASEWTKALVFCRCCCCPGCFC